MLGCDPLEGGLGQFFKKAASRVVARLAVQHARLRVAQVQALAGTGDDARAQVSFPRHGTKWLALSVAKLTVVE